MTGRWRYRPNGSNWGEFGPEDELGRLNLLTAERVRAGVAEVLTGETFSLSLPLDLPVGTVLNVARPGPVLRPTERDGRPVYLHSYADEYGTTDVTCDDQVTLALQHSTHWDSLAHVGARFDADGDGDADVVFYNGFRGGSDVAHGVEDGKPWSRAHRLGIDGPACHGVQGRGVLVDVYAHCGDDRVALGYDDLMAVVTADGVTVEEGDILCLHTGFADHVVRGSDDLQAICAVLDGDDPHLLDWIDRSGIAALVADNYAVEAPPHVAPDQPDGHALLPLHEHCLFKLGMPLGELWHLGDLAHWLRAHERHHFLLTAPPLRPPGAVGSPVTPVATV